MESKSGVANKQTKCLFFKRSRWAKWWPGERLHLIQFPVKTRKNQKSYHFKTLSLVGDLRPCGPAKRKRKVLPLSSWGPGNKGPLTRRHINQQVQEMRFTQNHWRNHAHHSINHVHKHLKVLYGYCVFFSSLGSFNRSNDHNATWQKIFGGPP